MGVAARLGHPPLGKTPFRVGKHFVLSPNLLASQYALLR
jgi:hypothetical protein